MQKLFIAIFTILACLHLAPAQAATADAAAQSVDRAFLDQVMVDQAAHTVRLTGWAVSRSGKVGNPTLDVRVGGRTIYSGPGQTQPRPDVAKQTGHEEWLDSGWTVSVPLTSGINPGDKSLLVTVRFGDEAPIVSHPSAPQNASINIPAERPRVRVRVALLIAALLPLCGFLFAPSLTRLFAKVTGRRVLQPVPTAVGCVLSFVILVAMGVSGSSLSEVQAPLPIAGLETTVIANSARNIRSDEWLVLSTMAIGQARHSPAFPIVNKNLGPNGQNMLVVGMTAVPVWRISALARPATWGYFFLPLPQAFAWHWWLPIFGCVLGLWACFCVLFPGNWRVCLALSGCFVASPYVVAWSYWPAYVTMFATIAFASLIALLKAQRGWKMLGYALLVGISTSGFILTLYPAWQVPIGYLFLLLLGTVLYRDRHELRFSAANLACVAIGLVIAGAAVVSWWLDAHGAVAAMMATLYPGQRSAELGGGIDSWYFARGVTNFTTLYADLSGVSNSSEVASFLYLTLPTLVGAVLSRAYSGKSKQVFYALVAFLVFASLYQFVGFPLWLAKLSLWGRTFASRVDLAAGIASIALLGCVLARDHDKGDTDAPAAVTHKLIAAAAAAMWVAIVWWSFSFAPEPIVRLFTRPTLVALLVVLGACSYLLAVRWTWTFLVSYFVVLMYSTSAFNPLTVVSATARPVTAHSDGTECGVAGGRTLVLGSNVPAMALMASGCPILDGVSYYPQMNLWQSLDPDGHQIAMYNRYQRLLFDLDDLNGSPQAEITAPQLDTVRVRFDSRAFDFARLPISHVLIESGKMRDLRLNGSLREVASPLPGFAMFCIIRR